MASQSQEMKSIIETRTDTINNIQEIIPGLWLGGSFRVSDIAYLQQYHILAMVNCTQTEKNHWPDKIEYMNVPILDSSHSDLSPYLEPSFAWILKQLKAKKQVLVHCKMGMSRSVAIVAYFLGKHLNWSLKTCLDRIKLRRNCIEPNKGFILQLRAALLSDD